MKYRKQLAFYPLALLASLFSLPALAEDEVDEPVFTQAELDQLLAPIALYPDVLLSQVLMAATYPLEVVEASRWSRANAGLEGDEAVQAVEEEAWDMSVKALVGFPDLIQRMDENLDWTRRLGDAFLLQEEQVMETTQRLRERALAEGTLDSMEHITVERQTEQIIIEPADVRVVYVPYYSTRVVYGDWWWNDYPPYYWGPPIGSYSSIGLSWSRGFRVSTHFYYSTFDWPRRSVVIVNSHRGPNRFDFHRSQVLRRYDHYAHVWHHDPYHRKGVRYRDPHRYDRYDRYSRDRVRDSQRVRIPYPDRDRRMDRIDRQPDRRPDLIDRRPESVDRRSRIDRYQRERLRNDPPTINRPPVVRPERPNTRPERSPVVRPERPNTRPDRQTVSPERRTRPDRPATRPETPDRPERQRPVVVTRPQPQPKPSPEVRTRTTDRSSRPSYTVNSRSERIQRNPSDRSRSLERRAPGRRIDP